MCTSKPKIPQAAPPPPPAPIPTPTETSPLGAEDSRRKRTETMRYGLASTIKTSARGITGAGADLTSAGLQGKKTKTGQ